MRVKVHVRHIIIDLNLHGEHCTVYSVHCTLYNVQYEQVSPETLKCKQINEYILIKYEPQKLHRRAQ